ncbi:hypothetical protein F0562_010410 [Nyssa sinensis]|uniref:Uncharacterized protein n=1 Tax=Nyssa sinensis TaxID=561372 RepID=A0A5J5A1K0_9ASTE|nr:hypothetical protein F0562_010410 [Nyssa sinensis]
MEEATAVDDGTRTGGAHAEGRAYVMGGAFGQVSYCGTALSAAQIKVGGVGISSWLLVFEAKQKLCNGLDLSLSLIQSRTPEFRISWKEF